MKYQSIVLVAAMTLSLSACAAKKTPPPQIRYDPPVYTPATRITEPPKPVRIVEVAKPVPMPGQLIKLPEPGEVAKDERPPTERVDAANEDARQEPTKHGFINAIQNWPYAEGALYQVYTAPERITDIALQPGEKLVSVSAGDTVRWVLGDTESGSGAGKRTHIIVKPFAPDLNTNLVITTDRRTYHLQLVSTEKTAMAAVSWSYPTDQLVALRRQNAEAEAAETFASNLSLENMKFRYAITGDNPPWRPVRAFDDTHKVYIQFPARIDQGETPPLFIVGPDGGNQLVNYRVKGNYYIVDRLFAAAELRLGKDNQQIVRISRTDTIPSNGGGGK